MLTRSYSPYPSLLVVLQVNITESVMVLVLPFNSRSHSTVVYIEVQDVRVDGSNSLGGMMAVRGSSAQGYA